MDSKIIDANTYDFILHNAKLMNKDYNEEILIFYIDKVINDITIKTNRNKFPTDLKYLVVDLIGDLLDTNKVINNSSEQQGIQSLSENGRSVNFGMDSFSQSRFNMLLQQKISDNEKLINRYRLLYKVVNRNGEN